MAESSAHSRRPSPGNFGKLDKPRAEADFYRSPANAIRLLVDPLNVADILPPVPISLGLIVDAGAGDGRLTRGLLETGHRVLGLEWYHRGHDPALPIRTGVDFLAIEDLEGADTIVTNPPYSLADEFIRHGLALLPSGRELHALLRHNWMCGARRRDLTAQLCRIIMCRRLKMLPPGADDRGHSGMADYSWFTFRKSWRADCQIIHAVSRTDDGR